MTTPYDNHHFHDDRSMATFFSAILNSIPSEHHPSVMAVIRAELPQLCITYDPRAKKVTVDSI